MTTKAAFIAAVGGAKLPVGAPLEFVRSSGNILTATAHGLKTGAGPYKVMNNVADAPAGLVEAVHASTTITATNPIATDVITIAGKAYTFIATPAADGDVDVGAATTVGTAKSMINLAAAINRDLLAAAATYDLDTVRADTVKAILQDVAATTILKIQAETLDAALGNAIGVVSSDGTMVVGNATLENGANGTDYFVIRLDADTFSLATSRALALAGTAQVITDAGTGIHTLVATTDTVAEELFNAFVAAGAVTGRTFEVLTHGGWRRVNPHQLVSGDVIRVLDNGAPQPLAPAMSDGDLSGLYRVAQVQTSVVVAVRNAGNEVSEVAIAFDTP